jgi:hypothetical protein
MACMGSSFRYGQSPTIKLNNANGVVIPLAAHTVCIAGDGLCPPLTLNKPATTWHSKPPREEGQ